MKTRSFSIIIPTYEREKELFEYIDSVLEQDYDLQLVELLIIDQNDVIQLDDKIAAYNNRIAIKHLKTTIKGIAHAKNTGIKNAKAEIITFADDDSKYYPDTLKQANQCFENNPDVDIFYGKIFDRKNNKDILRTWKKDKIRITPFNYHLNYNAISCFTPHKQIQFDERFGVGTTYGMGEELDYLLQALKKKANVWYTPEIEVWHPELHVRSMNDQKVFSYAKGYGAICKKYLSFTMLWNFALSSAFQLTMAIVMLLTGKTEQAHKRFLALKGRFRGLIEFKP